MADTGRRRRACAAAAASGLLIALACRGEQAPTPSGPPMAVLAPKARAAGANRPPEIRALRLEPAEPVAGRRVRAVVDAADPDGDPIRLRYAWTHGGDLVGEDAGVATDALRKGDRLELSVVASDGVAESRPATASLRIRNRPPQISFVGIDPPEILAPGQVLAAVVEARDPDGDAVSYRYAWRRNRREVQGARDATYTPRRLQPGDELTLRVFASDGEDESRPVESFAVRMDNRAPEIVSQPGGVREDGEFRYRVEARDPDGDGNLRFELLEAPDGMRIDDVLGEIVWRPAPAQVGRFAVDVAVRDERGAASAQRFALVVAAPESGVVPAAPAATP